MSDETYPKQLPADPVDDAAAAVPPPPGAAGSGSGAAPPPPSGAGSNRTPILYGRLAVGAGVMFLGMLSFFPRIFQAFSVDEFWRLWPLILVGTGAVQLARAQNAKDRHGSAWVLMSGVVLLVHFVQLWGLTWGTGWPLWILAAGLIDLAFPEKPRDRGIGLFLLGLGSFLLFFRLGTLPEGWERGWPILVVLFGAVLVWQALFTEPGTGRMRRKSRGGNHDYR